MHKFNFMDKLIFSQSDLSQCGLLWFLIALMCAHFFPTSIATITFEEYKNLQGEPFCSTRSPAARVSICAKIAELNKIENYNQDFLVSGCWAMQISLVKKNGYPASRVDENLLHCHYQGIRNTFYEETFNYERAVGRGEKQSDVMEYTYQGKKAVPFMNRENLLEQISG